MHFALMLPGLLSEAAFHLEARKFWTNKLTAALMTPASTRWPTAPYPVRGADVER